MSLSYHYKISEKLQRRHGSGLVLTAFVLAFSLLLAGCSTPTTTPATTAAPTETTLAPTPIPSPSPTPTPEPPSTEHPVVALTFDDGPSLNDTGRLLDTLAAADVKATFFVLGSQIEAGREELVKREFDEGHEIANHTYSHDMLTDLDDAAAREEITKTSDLIIEITGQAPTLLRAPSNDFNATTKAICAELGLAIVSWSWQSCPEDWNHKGDPGYIAQYVIDNAANGHIILLHDINSSTVDSIQAMIEGLKAKGFRFMTVSELLATKGEGEPQAGKVYTQLGD